MEDGLVRCYLGALLDDSRVLILIVVEDGLVLTEGKKYPVSLPES